MGPTLVASLIAYLKQTNKIRQKNSLKPRCSSIQNPYTDHIGKIQEGEHYFWQSSAAAHTRIVAEFPCSCFTDVQELQECTDHGWLPKPVLSENHKNTDEDFFHYKVVLFGGEIGLQWMQSSFHPSLKSSSTSWADVPRQLSGCRGNQFLDQFLSLVFREHTGEQTFVCELEFWQHFLTCRSQMWYWVDSIWEAMRHKVVFMHTYMEFLLLFGIGHRRVKLLSDKGVAFYSLLSLSDVVLLTLFSTFFPPPTHLWSLTS